MFKRLKRLARDLWLHMEYEPTTNGHLDHDPPAGSGKPAPRRPDEIDREFYLDLGGSE